MESKRHRGAPQIGVLLVIEQTAAGFDRLLLGKRRQLPTGAAYCVGLEDLESQVVKSSMAISSTSEIAQSLDASV